MSSSALQQALINAGVNVFVNEHTEKFVHSRAKVSVAIWTDERLISSKFQLLKSATFSPAPSQDPLTEHAIYEQMALISTVCAFSWSRWNSRSGNEHLVIQVFKPTDCKSQMLYNVSCISFPFQACEHRGPGAVPEDFWKVYLLGAQKILKLGIVEESKTYNGEYDPKRGFHSTLIHMLQETMSAESVAESRKSSFLYVDTVQSLLCATRPLMFS